MTRVLEAAEQMGYKPNQSVRRFFKSLRGEISGLVFLVDDAILTCCSEPVYTRILGSVEQVLRRFGIHTLLAGTGDFDEQVSLRAIEEGVAHGVILSTSDERIIELVSRTTAAVVYNASHRVPKVDMVIPDLEHAAQVQIDALVRLGHTRIACFRPTPTSHWQDVQFWQEYYRYTAALGLEVPERWGGEIIIRQGNEPAAVSAFLDRILTDDPATAVIMEDYYAPELMRQVMLRGFSVPNDISIIGFNDSAAEIHCSVSLASYRQDFVTMAEEAVRLVRERASTPNRAARTVKVQGELILRDSVSQAPREHRRQCCAAPAH